jgi:hypothetical protein
MIPLIRELHNTVGLSTADIRRIEGILDAEPNIAFVYMEGDPAALMTIVDEWDAQTAWKYFSFNHNKGVIVATKGAISLSNFAWTSLDVQRLGYTNPGMSRWIWRNNGGDKNDEFLIFVRRFRRAREAYGNEVIESLLACQDGDNVHLYLVTPAEQIPQDILNMLGTYTDRGAGVMRLPDGRLLLSVREHKRSALEALLSHLRCVASFRSNI